MMDSTPHHPFLRYIAVLITGLVMGMILGSSFSSDNIDSSNPEIDVKNTESLARLERQLRYAENQRRALEQKFQGLVDREYRALLTVEDREQRVRLLERLVGESFLLVFASILKSPQNNDYKVEAKRLVGSTLTADDVESSSAVTSNSTVAPLPREKVFELALHVNPNQSLTEKIRSENALTDPLAFDSLPALALAQEIEGRIDGEFVGKLTWDDDQTTTDANLTITGKFEDEGFKGEMRAYYQSREGNQVGFSRGSWNLEDLLKIHAGNNMPSVIVGNDKLVWQVFFNANNRDLIFGTVYQGSSSGIRRGLVTLTRQ